MNRSLLEAELRVEMCKITLKIEIFKVMFRNTLVWMEFPVNKKSIINNSTMPQIYL